MKNIISENDFEENYKPQVNHIVGEDKAAFNGCMYETYGEELYYILQMANNPETARRVWTIIEGDGGMCYSAGYHFVNRLGYLITEKPYEDVSDWVELEVDLGDFPF